MTRRNSPQTIQNLDDLSGLDRVVVDKRLGQRSSAKKNRRNRHYDKQFIRHALTQQTRGPQRQHQDQRADASGHVAVHHFYPGLAVGHGPAGHHSLGGADVLGRRCRSSDDHDGQERSRYALAARRQRRRRCTAAASAGRSRQPEGPPSPEVLVVRGRPEVPLPQAFWARPLA